MFLKKSQKNNSNLKLNKKILKDMIRCQVLILESNGETQKEM